MKVFDVAKSGLANVAQAAQALAAPVIKAFARPEDPDPDVVAELRRRAEINGRAEAKRAGLERALFSSSRWVPPRRGWLERGR